MRFSISGPGAGSVRTRTQFVHKTVCLVLFVVPTKKAEMRDADPAIPRLSPIRCGQSGRSFQVSFLFRLGKPGDHPKIVRQHGPGHFSFPIQKPLAAQRAAQEIVLEDSHSTLGLCSPALQ